MSEIFNKPTITESRYRFMVEGMGFDFKAGFNDALGELGIEVIPDPEPTNTDRLEEILKEVWTPAQSARTFAEYLDEQGVTAPNE